jgi:hypothetical protein
MDIHQRDELWTDHDGQSRVMDYDAVEKELNKLTAEIERLRAALEAARAFIRFELPVTGSNAIEAIEAALDEQKARVENG